MYSNLVYTSFLVQHIRWLQQAITVIDTIWEGQWIENYLCTSAFAGNQMQDRSSKWGLLLTPPWPTSLTYTLVNLKTQKNTTFLLENRIFVYFEQYGSNSVACVLIILYLSQKKKNVIHTMLHYQPILHDGVSQLINHPPHVCMSYCHICSFS